MNENDPSRTAGKRILRIIAIMGLLVFALVAWIRLHTAPERVEAPPPAPASEEPKR